MQHHFVVKYDTDTDLWELDIDTQSAVFNNGNTYDPADYLEFNGWSDQEGSRLVEDVLAVYLDSINKGNFIIKERDN